MITARRASGCRKWAIVALMGLLIAATGCETCQGNESATLGQVTHEEIQSHIDAWAEANGETPIEIHIDSDDTYIGCPSLSVCDENYDYRAFIVASSGLNLRLSFDGALANEISLELLREYFSVASLLYRPPELDFDNWEVRLGGDVALRANDDAVEFTGWENGRSQGKIQTTLSGIYARVTEDDTIGAADPNCFVIGAQVPDECTARADVSVPLVVTFDLPLATGTQDCSGSHQPKGCGNSI